MSSSMNAQARRTGAMAPLFPELYNAISVSSKVATFIALLTMMLVMCLEVVMRYAVGAPLGWNVSLIEKLLLPGLVFLGLPWAYEAGSHITADLLYDRLKPRVQQLCRVISITASIVCILILLISGFRITADAIATGAVPPPLSSQLHVYTWIYRILLPIGASGTLILMLLDIPRKVMASKIYEDSVISESTTISDQEVEK